MKTSFPLLMVLGLLSVSLITACGGDQKSELDKLSDAAEEMADQAEKMAETAQDMTTEVTGDKEPQPAIHFKVLMTYLPTAFGDLEPGKPKGESASIGNWNYSSAEVRFRGPENSNVEVEIFDYAYISMLYASFNMMFKMNFNKESSEGFERTTEIGGYPAIEKWVEAQQNGEATVLVGERYIVTVNSHGLPEATPREVLESMNLSGLASEKADVPPA